MKNWRLWALAVITAWIICVALWAVQPMTVSVRVGTKLDGTEKTASVQCDSPLSGNTEPTDALPTFSNPRFAVRGAPCENPVTSGRTMFVVDVVIAAAALVLVSAVHRRGHPSTSDGTPATTVTA